jgi:hypothetical protein
MRFLPAVAGALAGALAVAPARAEEEQAAGPRVITLECTVPAKAALRTGAAVRLSCRVKGESSSERAAVALVDPFAVKYWETMDPFATVRPAAADEPFWEARSTLVDPFEPSASELRDPFQPAAGDDSDEP